MPTNGTDWRSEELSGLTRHIASTHHSYLHRQLPLLVSLLTAHVRQYWLKHPELLKAHTLLHQLRAAIDQHLIKEETVGFPLVEAYDLDQTKRLTPFANSINGHIAEHAAIGELLQQIRVTLWDYRVPEDIGVEVAFTCGLLEELEKDLAEHVHLEDDILFPRVRALAEG
ncbi:MAG: hemerythrin domain-containing protein [Bryobacterales bacterium]|nr:hemerythrin domain-containing protein [Bryobacterales bacterium]